MTEEFIPTCVIYVSLRCKRWASTVLPLLRCETWSGCVKTWKMSAVFLFVIVFLFFLMNLSFFAISSTLKPWEEFMYLTVYSWFWIPMIHLCIRGRWFIHFSNIWLKMWLNMLKIIKNIFIGFLCGSHMKSHFY